MTSSHLVAPVILFIGLVAGCSGDDPGNGTGGNGGDATASGGGDPSTGGSGGAPSTGGAGGTGGMASGGGSPCAALNDEFDDAITLSCWTELDAAQGDPAQYSVLDIDETKPGMLTLEPNHTQGWFEDGDAPFLFKEIAGDFVVETHVTALSRNDLSSPPSQQYNSAGLLVRDGAATPGDEDWLMYNIGYQETFVGTEGKTTQDSQSILTLTPGANAGRLRICRVGSDYQMYRWLDGETSWTLEHSYSRPDLPATVQVGLIANGYQPPPDLHARFDYARFGTVTSQSDCTAELTD